MSRWIGTCYAFIALVVPCEVASADDQAPPTASGVEQGAASQSPEGDEDTIEKITARKLFLEGRALLDKAQTGEACATLDRSHRLNPTLATLLNLGLCYKALGRVVTAHDYYREAEIQATLKGDTPRREFAHDEAAALAPLRATLMLRVAGAQEGGLEILVDDKPLAREVWNRPIFIESGEHRIAVRSSDAQTWEGSVTVTDGREHLVVVPELVRRPSTADPLSNASKGPTTVTSATPPVTSFERSRPPQPDVETLSTQRIIAYGTGVAGLGALAVSAIYAVNAKSTWNDSNSRGCDVATNLCSAEGLSLRDDARAAGTRSTVFAIAGGALLVGSLVLWLAYPSHTEERANLSLWTSRDSVAATWRGVL